MGMINDMVRIWGAPTRLLVHNGRQHLLIGEALSVIVPGVDAARVTR
jgi:hypothetical protein